VIQAIDIAPTVLDALGIAAPPGFQGRSALPLLDGDPLAAAREEAAFSQAANFPGLNVDVAVREGRWKLIRHADAASSGELYDLSSDPGEKKDLSRDRPEISTRLNRDLDEWDARNAAAAAALPRPAFDAPISGDTAAKLRAAGYIK
jgi:arylsulfatase A-like enzyme